MENPITNNNSSNTQLLSEAKVQKKSKFESFFAGEKALKVIQKLDSFFIKLPHLPKKLNLLISNVVPWIALIGGIVGAIAAILSFALTLLSLIAFDLASIIEMTGSSILILLSTLLLIRAFKPLRAKNAVGWIYLFWSQVLEVLNLIVRVWNREDYILLNLFIILLNFYLLFEIGQFYVYKKSSKTT